MWRVPENRRDGLTSLIAPDPSPSRQCCQSLVEQEHLWGLYEYSRGRLTSLIVHDPSPSGQCGQGLVEQEREQEHVANRNTWLGGEPGGDGERPGKVEVWSVETLVSPLSSDPCSSLGADGGQRVVTDHRERLDQ